MLQSAYKRETKQNKGSLAFSKVSIRESQRSFKYFLFFLVSISICATSIENGLHQTFLLVLPLVYLSLLRRNYVETFLFSERTAGVLFFVYCFVFSFVLWSIHGALSPPYFIVHFTFGLLIVRLLSPLTDRNIWQIIFLSLGLILINCILTNHVAFGLILPFYFFALIGTLLLFQFARSQPPSGEIIESPGTWQFWKSWYGNITKWTLFLVGLSIILFVILPRPFIVIPGLRVGAKTGGLAELDQQIRYRDMIEMSARKRIAFLVKVEKGVLPEYPFWRGRVLDKTDGANWSPATEVRTTSKLLRPERSQIVTYEIIPYRLQSKVLYCSGLPLWATGRGDRSLYITSEFEVVVDSPFLFSSSYKVTSANVALPVASRKHDVNLSRDGITPKIEALANQWASGYTKTRDKASVLASRLKSEFKYSLVNPVPPEDTHPIEYFLFETRRGNCELFAGTLCLMLRSIGVPARVVEGFAGAEPSGKPNEFIVRFSRAHAWVEAVLDGSTWTTLDATPAARADIAENYLWRLIADAYDELEYNWIKYVVYFDRSDQAEILQAVRRVLKGDFSIISIVPKAGPVVMILIIGFLGLLIVSLLSYKFCRRADLPEIYFNTMKKLTKIGVLGKVHPWHEDNSQEIIKNFPLLKNSLLKFMELYMKVRFGMDKPGGLDKIRFAQRELLQAAKKMRNA